MVPALPPVTTPVASTVATARLLLLHVPPGVLLLSAVVSPGHTVSVPVVTGARGLTVIVVVAIQPVGNI